MAVYLPRTPYNTETAFFYALDDLANSLSDVDGMSSRDGRYSNPGGWVQLFAQSAALIWGVGSSYHRIWDEGAVDAQQDPWGYRFANVASTIRYFNSYAGRGGGW